MWIKQSVTYFARSLCFFYWMDSWVMEYGTDPSERLYAGNNLRGLQKNIYSQIIWQFNSMTQHYWSFSWTPPVMDQHSAESEPKNFRHDITIMVTASFNARYRNVSRYEPKNLQPFHNVSHSPPPLFFLQYNSVRFIVSHIQFCSSLLVSIHRKTQQSSSVSTVTYP